MRTPGPYLREDRTVYALESIGFRKGIEQFQNRIYAGFQGGPKTPPEEVEATAAYFQLAANCHDELVAALEWARKGLQVYMERAGLRFVDETPIIEAIDKALAKAKQEAP